MNGNKVTSPIGDLDQLIQAILNRSLPLYTRIGKHQTSLILVNDWLVFWMILRVHDENDKRRPSLSILFRISRETIEKEIERMMQNWNSTEVQKLLGHVGLHSRPSATREKDKSHVSHVHNITARRHRHHHVRRAD